MPDSYIRPWISLGEATMIYDSLDEVHAADGAFDIVSRWDETDEDGGERRYSVEEMLAIQHSEATVTCCPKCGLDHPWACVECGTPLASGGSGEAPAGLTREQMEFLLEVVGTAGIGRRLRADQLGVRDWLRSALRGPVGGEAGQDG